MTAATDGLGLVDARFDLADRITEVMETRPVGITWSPSGIRRKLPADARPECHEIRAVLVWMERFVYVTSNGRGGAWRRWARRH